MYIRTGPAPISDESAHNQGKKQKILDILNGRYSAPKDKKYKKGSSILQDDEIHPEMLWNDAKHEYDAFLFVWEDGFRGMHFVLQMPKRA